MAERDNSTASEIETESSEEEENEMPDGQIQPYMFEPRQALRAEVSEEEELDMEADPEDNHNEQRQRLGNLNWCTCDNCQLMDKGEECICCKECQNTTLKLSDNIHLFGENIDFSCITDHQGFQSICLNPWVLQVAWLGYKQHYENVYEGPLHKKYRHVAYRQYVRWVHGYVGKQIRVVIPSCAVSCIRAHFPPPGNEEHFQFVGFKYPDL